MSYKFCVRMVPRIGVSALGLEQAHHFHIFEFLRAVFFLCRALFKRPWCRLLDLQVVHILEGNVLAS